jgi:sec-independent protein translocase protein TatC
VAVDSPQKSFLGNSRAVDRPALPKEDLFDTATMTFGEHLDELRKALARAIVWLVAGALLALVVAAKPVVLMIQGPLEQAIIQYNTDRSLAKLGYDPAEKAVRNGPLREWMLENGMAWELIYVVPTELLNLPEGQPEKTTQPEPVQGADTGANTGDAISDTDRTVAPAAPIRPTSESAAEASKEDTAAGGASQDKKNEPKRTKQADEPEAVVPPTVVEEPQVAAKPAKSQPNVESPERKKQIDPAPTPQTERQVATMSSLLRSVPDPSKFVPQLQLKRIEAGLNSHQIEEPFMIYLKASFVIGAVIASPGIFFHLWQFVAAGLYPHERKYVYIYLPFSVSLFVGGVCLAFFAVLRYVLSFLLDFNSTLSVDLEPRLSYYMSFVLLLPLGFGIAFQLPLVMLFLQRIGIFETSAYEKSWRIAVLVIAFLSMILTPADPYSMILLMCPLVCLYFLGIGLCRFMPRGRGLGSAAYDPR